MTSHHCHRPRRRTIGDRGRFLDVLRRRPELRRLRLRTYTRSMIVVSHPGADAQCDQRGRKLASFQFVKHGAEDHCAGSAERMAQRNGATVDVDLGGIEIERLQIAQHHRSERPLTSIRSMSAKQSTDASTFCTFDRPSHQRRGPSSIGECSDLCARFEPGAAVGAVCCRPAPPPRRPRCRTNCRRGGRVDVFDVGMRLDGDGIEAALSPICANEGCSDASDCMVVPGRRCSSLSRMVRPFTSFTANGLTEQALLPPRRCCSWF